MVFVCLSVVLAPGTQQAAALQRNSAEAGSDPKGPVGHGRSAGQRHNLVQLHRQLARRTNRVSGGGIYPQWTNRVRGR
eukprot:3431489-Pyramimonas_sp.AAC.2